MTEPDLHTETRSDTGRPYRLVPPGRPTCQEMTDFRYLYYLVPYMGPLNPDGVRGYQCGVPPGTR